MLIECRTGNRTTRLLALLLLLSAVFSTSDKSAAAETNGKASPLVILFTGNTHSYLDVASPDLGGLSRRTHAIIEARMEKAPVLLLDAGGVFDGEEPFDKHRSSTYLQLLTLLGHAAINLSPDELRFGWEWLADILRESHFGADVPLVSANLRVPNEYADIKMRSAGVAEIGPWRVGLVGFAYPEHTAPASAKEHWEEVVPAASRVVSDLKKQADVVVVLASVPRDVLVDLAAVRGVDLIVSADSGPESEKIGSVTVVHCEPNGISLGRVDAEIDGKGLHILGIVRLPLDAKVPRDRGVEEVLAAFRAETATKAEFHTKPIKPLPKADRAYVGAEVCADCHKDQFAQWRQTKHAHAFDSLYEGQRHLLPSCQSCHTTGFGHEGGYDPTIGTPGLRNVSCESCHGPASEHVLNPAKTNIRKTVEATLCAQCHDESNSPDFEFEQQRYAGEIDHKHFVPPTPSPVVKRPPTTPVVSASKPLIELFTMSMCPYGMKTEELLFDWLEKVGDRVEFRLHFVARDQQEIDAETVEPSAEDSGRLRFEEEIACSGEPEPSEGPFASLHGPAEVAEDIRQAVIMELYPDRYRKYILCRNKDIRGGDWRVCALQNGIDADAVEQLSTGPEGEKMFRKNIARAHALNIKASPTVLINGTESDVPIRILDIMSSVCQSQPDLPLCTEEPACLKDADCDQPGRIGICVGAGTLDAKCTLHDPSPFELIAINAPANDCSVCYSGPGLQSLLRLFPYCRVRSLAYEDPLAQKLAKKYELNSFPSYLLGKNVQEHPRYDRIRNELADFGDYMLLDPGLNAISYFPNRKPKVGGIDVWVEPHSESSLRVETGLISHAALRKGYCNFHYLVSDSPSSSTELRQWPSGVSSRYSSANGIVELKHSTWQLCIQKDYPEHFYKYLTEYRGFFGLPWAGTQSLKTVNIPLEKVQRCAQGRRGVELMDRNFKLQKELHIRYAPMVLINNQLLMTASDVRLVRKIYDLLNPPE